MNNIQQLVISEFIARYQEQPALVVRAPGRVNIIGEHTDYNDGFVLPMAINRAAWIALRPRSDSLVELTAIDMGKTLAFNLEDLVYDGPGWIEYVKGIAFSLQEAGYYLKGWEGIMAGDVPIGAGLSSSAALELAAARAFASVSNLPWDPVEMARIGQAAENQWVGMNCGIMDQMISAAGEAGHALLIDCRSLATETVPLPLGTNIVVMDTATRRGLVDSAYNERRRQCETAAAFFGVPALRDVDMQTFIARASELDPLIRRRARHVISENERTIQAALAMKNEDGQTLGKLMDASHISMRDDFEISGEELNQMVTLAQGQAGCFGARMTGGGFAGCAVALVESANVNQFAMNVGAAYMSATGLEPQIYICDATNGAAVVDLS